MASAIYLRKSRAEEQTEPADVLLRHRQALVELAQRRGISIAEVYEEVVSGESLYARPEMQKLLQAVQNDAYDSVLCMDIDRLGRGGMSDQGIILDTFRFSETLIITPDKTYDLRDDVDEELTEFKAFMARREYKLIRKRMRRGLMQTIQEGGYVANAPYGYKKCACGKLPSLEIVEEEARFIRLIYDRYQSGVGAASIACELNSLGSRPRRSSSWSRGTVRNVLGNPTYMGKVAWNRVKHQHPQGLGYRPELGKGQDQELKHRAIYTPPEEWIIAQGKHPAIIPEEEWNQAQTIRKSRYVPSHSTGKLANPLAGLIKCSVCGRNMQLQSPSGKEAYLLCTTKGCCAGVKFEYVEFAVLEALREELAAVCLTPPVRKALEAPTLAKAVDHSQRALEKVEQRVNHLYELLEDGTYDPETFRQRMLAAEADKKMLSGQLEELRKKHAASECHNAAPPLPGASNALELYAALDASGKNRLLKSVIDSIEYIKLKKSRPRSFTLTIQLHSA